MNPFERIRNICLDAISNKVFPGCQVAVCFNGFPYSAQLGRLTYEENSLNVTEHTLYDVASLTKALTAMVAWRLITAGQIKLDGWVKSYVPELTGSHVNNITIRDLLSYRTIFDLRVGLNGHRGEEAIKKILSTGLVERPGEFFFYGNIAPIVLGYVLEKVSGRPLAKLLQEEVCKPLLMFRTGYWDASSAFEAAPTELSDEESHFVGVPHDATARAIERPSGVSGVFSNASDIGKFADLIVNQFCRGPRRMVEYFLSKEIVTNQVLEIPHFSWSGDHSKSPAYYGLGLDMLSPDYIPEYSQICSKTVLMTGFTGCSMMCNQDMGIYAVLLSNAVHPKRPEKVAGQKAPIYHVRKAIWRTLIEAGLGK